LIDQLVIGTVYSYDDYEASVKERTIKDGKKKEIRETVPFSNATYDFSAINGEVYWEEKELEYVFEILANSPEELEEKKRVFKSWIMNVMNAELHDPFIRDYHFIATFSSIDVDDSEIEKATITGIFKAYPYMIADNVKLYQVALVANKDVEVVVHNDSSHKITPTFNADVPFILKIGSASYAISAGETTDDSFKFDVGLNEFTLQAQENGTLEISFYEEVF